MISLGGAVGSAPVRRAGDPGSNPGSGENFALACLMEYQPAISIQMLFRSLYINNVHFQIILRPLLDHHSNVSSSAVSTESE